MNPIRSFLIRALGLAVNSIITQVVLRLVGVATLNATYETVAVTATAAAAATVAADLWLGCRDDSCGEPGLLSTLAVLATAHLATEGSPLVILAGAGAVELLRLIDNYIPIMGEFEADEVDW